MIAQVQMTVTRSNTGEVPAEVEEIRHNWRAWARRNGYQIRETIPVQAGAVKVSLKTYERQSEQDPFLLHQPCIPGSPEALYLVPDEAALKSLTNTITIMARSAGTHRWW